MGSRATPPRPSSACSSRRPASRKAKCMANMADCCGTASQPDDLQDHRGRRSRTRRSAACCRRTSRSSTSSGSWKPVPGGKSKNGMSVGLGFTSVKATF